MPVWPYWMSTPNATTLNVGTSGSVNVWPGWVSQPTVTTTAATSAWNAWVDPGTVGTQATYPQQIVWQQWQLRTTVGPIGHPVIAAYVPAPVPWTARDLLIRENRQRSSRLRRRNAERRAEALLLEHLSEAQREEWERERAFTVHTAEGKRAYRIAYGLAGNVRLLKADEPPISRWGYPIRTGARFCMHVYHPDGWVPNEDNVLAQKLLLESDEAEFLRLANVS